MEQKQIQKWKSQYGRVFKIKLENKDVYYRPLTVGEYEVVSKSTNLIPDLVILNDIKLELPGSINKLGNLVLKESIIKDEDDLRERAIQGRYDVKERMGNDIYYNIIIQICRIFPSYTPEELFSKTRDQLLKIVAIAETVTNTHIILTGDEPKDNGKIPRATPNYEERNNFQPPDTQSMMDEASDALSAEMSKYGKKSKKFKKKSKSSDPFTAKTEELDQFLKGK